MRPTAGATESPGTINEYLKLVDDLSPVATVWHPSRFERFDTSGLQSS